MRRYRPASYSKQAREFCDKLLQSIELGYCTIEQAFLTIHNSYRSKLVRRRALARFIRKLHNGNYVESPEAIKEWERQKAEYGVYRESIEEEAYNDRMMRRRDSDRTN